MACLASLMCAFALVGWHGAWVGAGATSRTVELLEGEWRPIADEAADFAGPASVQAGWRLAPGKAIYQGRPEALPVDITLTDIAALPDGSVVAVGADGTVLRRNRFAEWKQESSRGPDLAAIAVNPDGEAFAVGGHGTLMALGPPVRMLGHGRGPDLVALRLVDGRFIAQAAGGGSWLQSFLYLAMVLVTGLFAAIILLLTGRRALILRDSTALHRAIGKVVLDVDPYPEGGLAYEVACEVLAPVAAGTVEVVLRVQQATVDSRHVLGALMEPHVLAAAGAGDTVYIKGRLTPSEDLLGSTGPDGVELWMDVRLELGRARGTFAAALP